ncbi:hypothetical protein Bbelb_143650 [Branchiostoma belcheri]|nr:hypothetical protein Bbelb_143650 [Branchiostoma belcheri]
MSNPNEYRRQPRRVMSEIQQLVMVDREFELVPAARCSRRTNHALKLQTIASKNNYYMLSFFPRTIQDWNELEPDNWNPSLREKCISIATVTTRRTCFCVLSTCKNVGKRTASVRAYERATYGLRESNFTILTCNCCTDSARSTSVPRTVLASSVLTPHFPVDLLNDHAEHTCTILVYKDDLTGDCQLVSKMPRKAQKKSTRQDPKKRAAEDTRAASDDEVNRRCTHLQRASVSCRPRTYTLRVTYSLGRPPYVCRKNVADVATTKTYGQKARTASCDRGLKPLYVSLVSSLIRGRDRKSSGPPASHKLPGVYFTRD